MKKLDVAYIGLDLHATSSTFGVIDGNGAKCIDQELPTNPKRLSQWLDELPVRHRFLAIEEGPLTQWIAWQLADTVDEVIVCDPKENYLISRSSKKSDVLDAVKLARLLRMGELHSVWHPGQKNDRALFAAAAAHYIAMRREQVRLKHKIKSMFRRWGVLDVTGEAIYRSNGRKDYLKQIDDQIICDQLSSYYALMDQAEQAQQRALKRLRDAGTSYDEITEFQKMPGIGPIGANIFSALVQTPHRFEGASQLWRWSGLGITDRSSSGKPLGYQRLDPSGRTDIKDISYRAWKAGARQTIEPNEVSRFYEKSLIKSNTPTNARLNTQRKVLKVLWTIWRKQVRYNPDLF
jgi:hypothetical protein